MKKDNIGARVRKNMGIMLSAKGVAGVMALGGLAFAARGLTVEEFGILVFMHAVVLFFTRVATFRSWLIVVRYAANGKTGVASAHEDPFLFGKVMRFCISLDFIACLAAFILAQSALLILTDQFEIVESAGPLLELYIFLVLFNQKSASLGVLRLFDRYDLIALNALIIPAGRMLGCGVAWYLEAPFVAYVSVWFVASAVSYLILPVLAVRHLKQNGLWRTILSGRPTLIAPSPGVWRFAVLTNVDASIGAGNGLLPIILAGVVGGPAFAAIYRIAKEVAVIIGKGSKMIDKVVFPEFTNLVASGKGQQIPGLIAKVGGVMAAFGALIGVVFWLVGPQFLSFALGPEYAETPLLAILLIISATLAAAGRPIFPALYAANLPLQAIASRLAALVTMIACFLVFYDLIGQTGPGYALIIAAFVRISLGAFFIQRLNWQSRE